MTTLSTKKLCPDGLWATFGMVSDEGVMGNT